MLIDETCFFSYADALIRELLSKLLSVVLLQYRFVGDYSCSSLTSYSSLTKD